MFVENLNDPMPSFSTALAGKFVECWQWNNNCKVNVTQGWTTGRLGQVSFFLAFGFSVRPASQR